MSSSWTNIFKTGNDTDQESLNLFRQFHCADCLKSFQQKQSQQQPDILKTNSAINYKLNDTKLSKSEQLVRPNRLQMNTPPPPLQPIADEAKNGLYHYFGQQNQTVSAQTNHMRPLQQQQSKLEPTVELNHIQSPFLSSPYSPFHHSAQQNAIYLNEIESDFKDDDDYDDDEDDRNSQISIQEKQQCWFFFLLKFFKLIIFFKFYFSSFKSKVSTKTT